jgi:hypothetical protein
MPWMFTNERGIEMTEENKELFKAQLRLEEIDLDSAAAVRRAAVKIEALTAENKTLRADKAQLVELAQICFSDDKTIDQPVCCSGGSGNPENACGCMGITERVIAEHELKQVVAEHTEGETNAVCDHGKRLVTYCQPCGRIHGGG